ncbi:MAG: TonB family protein [Planctomycetota bacterium]
MLKPRTITGFFSRPSGGLSAYFLISAAGHVIILGALFLSPGLSGPKEENSPIMVYIKPEEMTVDFKPERINPADFRPEPLTLEKFPEITISCEDEPIISRPGEPVDASASDYSTEAKPILDGSNKLPPYPRLARQLGQEGLVLLSVEIDENGRAREVRVARSSGYKLLDDAAVKTVRGWIFIPATKNGKPVTSKVEIPIRFKLT